MFKTLKYLLLANLYKRAKKNFLILFGSIIFLILISLIMSDAISVASGFTLYILIIVKWVIVLFLIGSIGLSLIKIVNAATSSFVSEDKKRTVVDVKKDRILNKERLFTKSDSILQKHMKD